MTSGFWVVVAFLRSLLCGVLLRELLGRPGFALSDPQVLELLRVVNEVVSRPAVVGGMPGGKGVKAFLTEGLRRSGGQVSRDLKAAAALNGPDPALLAMVEALGAGVVNRDHVDVAVAMLPDIPVSLKWKVVTRVEGGCETGLQFIDRVVTEQARVWAPGEIKGLTWRIRHRLDPERESRFDPEACERRSCTVSTESFGGMGLYGVVLDPVTLLQVSAALARAAAPRPAGTAVGQDGVVVRVPDRRDHRQRMADAVAELILAGAIRTGIITRPTIAPTIDPTSEEAADSTADPIAEEAGDPTGDPTGDEVAGQGVSTGQGDGVPGVVVAEICVLATVEQFLTCTDPADPADADPSTPPPSMLPVPPVPPVPPGVVRWRRGWRGCRWRGRSVRIRGRRSVRGCWRGWRVTVRFGGSCSTRIVRCCITGTATGWRVFTRSGR